MLKKIAQVVIVMVLMVTVAQAQEFSLVNSESSLEVFGTSSLHDWEIEAEQLSGTINFENIEACNIKSLSFSVVAKSLKSGKSGMDKNTYKALKTDEYKNITFQLTKVSSVTNKGGNVFDVSALGNLTIAGTKKQVSMKFTISADSSKVKLEGEKSFKMSTFNVEPPTALFGTVTTGDDITVKFSTTFK